MKSNKFINQDNLSINKPINAVNPLKKNPAIAYHKKNNKKQITSKTINNKRRAVSLAEKNISKQSTIKANNSFDNSLELDYLNFSKIDLYRFNQSFEDDIFTPNNNKKRKNIVEDRYEDTISTMNGNSTIIKNDEINLDINSLNTKEKDIMNTPSSMCNYYEQSTNKKNIKNNDSSNFINKLNDEIKKNLSEYYNKSSDKEQNRIKNAIKEKDENIYKIKGPNLLLNNEKPSTKYLKQNLKRNSILNKNNTNQFSQVSSIDKKDRKKDNKPPNSQNKTKKIISKNKNNELNINKKYSKSNEKFQYKISNKSALKNTKEEIKQSITNNNKGVTSVNSIKEKTKKQKPLNLYYNQNKFDEYMVTPRNINKSKNGKNISSNKSNKIIINTGPITKNRSFVTNNNKDNNIKNNLIYMNNNETNNPDNSNYKIIKELISDFTINTKKLNKTTPKNRTKTKKEEASYKKDIIKVNLKNSTKSSSNFASTQNNFSTKNKNQIFYPFNQKSNYPNTKLKSEIKNSFNIYKNISKKEGNNSIYSPVNKNPSSINFEAQKTLTEQNVFFPNMQEATPKNYKVQKYDSVPFTAMVKKIFIGSSKKDNFSSLKKKQNAKTKTEQMKCIFKPKTQSDLKNYEKMFGLGGDYGNDKHVKQKLLDRMNKATNNWQYIFNGNKNKKILDDGVSNMKNNNNHKDKEYIDYFYKNENIISDGSEKEDED